MSDLRRDLRLLALLPLAVRHPLRIRTRPRGGLMTSPTEAELAGEEWRAVVGYEGQYEVSNIGRFRSLDRISVRKNGYRVPLKGRIQEGYVTRHGYRRVSLGKRTHVLLHRLALEAFVGPPPADKPEGCHRDGNQLNNRIDNLYWGDRSDNMRDLVSHGRHPASNKTHCKNGHPFDESNTRPREGRTGPGRRCIQCRRESQARYDARRRGSEVAT